MFPHESIIQPSPLMPRINTPGPIQPHVAWGQRENKKDRWDRPKRKLSQWCLWTYSKCTIYMLNLQDKHPLQYIKIKMLDNASIFQMCVTPNRCWYSVTYHVTDTCHVQTCLCKTTGKTLGKWCWSNIWPDEYFGSMVQREKVLIITDGSTGL